VNDEALLDKLFIEQKVAAVIHFAGLKAVGESGQKPLEYYHNNVSGFIALLRAVRCAGVDKFIFSSSATVYGEPERIPMDETLPAGRATNPYGRTKFMIEQILCDVCHADAGFTAMLLRYFNPIGAHESGRIGEDPFGIPNNLLPFITQTAIGRREQLSVFGNDYPTPDGTCIRDYIHVVDLAKGHVKALEYAMKHTGCDAINLGTGRGYSVLEVIAAFERASGVKLNYAFAPRREGDVPMLCADPAKAEKLLGWKAERTIDDMCADAWRFQTLNPKGYTKAVK
jgi:UDP-glucose 4-epimerase